MSTIWNRFAHELRDPRKAALVVVLLVAASLLWGRFLMDRAPQTAAAKPDAVAAPVTPSGYEPPPPPPRHEPERLAAALDLADGLERDLFALPRDRFRSTKDQRTEPEAEKSDPEAVDELSRRSAVRAAAAGLRLESLITGDHPRAVINGRVLTPQQRVDGFTLVRVAERFVVLERDGVTVRLDL